MSENAPQPEELYAEHKEFALDLEAAKSELPVYDHVIWMREQIGVIEARIEDAGKEAPQAWYDDLAKLRSDLMQYRLNEQRNKIDSAAYKLESNVLDGQQLERASNGTWQEQARDEMSRENGRDAGDLPEAD